ncbi:hypothetical protein L6452_41828 [Arctium lappa]|uniref:Uncharacterized protein n=1 Tax=Arctium lappa TaxID=4217 RepID=A0ACB8XGI1_ARCLA|nr:hypothetical protein L6452_41828 [Arctium lappa]
MELQFLVLLVFFLGWPTVRPQPLSDLIPKSANDLNVMLQDYAYRAFTFERTGIPFDGIVPSYLTGINISALRLRSGSLYSRGFDSYKEFVIPPGVMDGPRHVERLVFVYHNLGNWSSHYYPLTGDHMYLAPIFGLLAYNGSDLSATNLPVLEFNATEKPITFKFGPIKPVSSGRVMKCVWFDVIGSKPVYYEMAPDNTCLLSTPGHCSIVDAPFVHHRHTSHVGKTIAQVFLGALVLGYIMGLLIFHIRGRRNRTMENRETMTRAGTHYEEIQLATTECPKKASWTGCL